MTKTKIKELKEKNFRELTTEEHEALIEMEQKKAKQWEERLKGLMIFTESINRKTSEMINIDKALKANSQFVVGKVTCNGVEAVSSLDRTEVQQRFDTIAGEVRDDLFMFKQLSLAVQYNVAEQEIVYFEKRKTLTDLKNVTAQFVDLLEGKSKPTNVEVIADEYKRRIAELEKRIKELPL